MNLNRIALPFAVGVAVGASAALQLSQPSPPQVMIQDLLEESQVRGRKSMQYEREGADESAMFQRGVSTGLAEAIRIVEKYYGIPRTIAEDKKIKGN